MAPEIARRLKLRRIVREIAFHNRPVGRHQGNRDEYDAVGISPVLEWVDLNQKPAFAGGRGSPYAASCSQKNHANDTAKHIRPEKHQDNRDGRRRDAHRQLLVGKLAWLPQPFLGRLGGKHD